MHDVPFVMQDSPYPQRLIKALGRLQVQAIHIVPYRLYIYALIEQHTLYDSRSVAEMLGYTADDIQSLVADSLHSPLKKQIMPKLGCQLPA